MPYYMIPKYMYLKIGTCVISEISKCEDHSSTQLYMPEPDIQKKGISRSFFLSHFQG